jgi:predicted  nucleic acid-binding Zn-ribbon protein
MKNSLAKQIVAINKEIKRKERQLQTLADGRLTQALAKDYKRIKRDKERLNDAASTIAAVNLIGSEKIKNIPEMISTIEYALEQLKWYGDMSAIRNLENKLINFKK